MRIVDRGVATPRSQARGRRFRIRPPNQAPADERTERDPAGICVVLDHVLLGLDGVFAVTVRVPARRVPVACASTPCSAPSSRRRRSAAVGANSESCLVATNSFWTATGGWCAWRLLDGDSSGGAVDGDRVAVAD